MARPDGKLKISPHAEWGKDVGPVDDMKALQGEAERHQLAVQEMENYGPNPGLVGQGQGVDGASGRALLAQRDSGMTEMQPIFERQREWKLRCYRKMWDRVRQAWNAERFIRVTDDENATQFVPINAYQMDPMTGQIQAQNVVAEIDVDISLDEGPDTITMNEELMDQFTQLGAAAMSPLGMIVLELSNTPKKDQLKKMIEEGMQAMQPGPDPALEAKMQAEQAKIAADQEKMQFDAQIKEHDAAREAEKDARDAERKDIEFAQNMKMKELEMEGEARKQMYAAHAHQQKIDAARELAHLRVSESREKIEMQRNADDEAKKPAREQFAQQFAPMVEEMNKTIAKLVKLQSAPRRIVRDKDGRPIGAVPVLDEADA
jgi:hypothetical protein